jgi:hypothetical protein
MGLYLRGALDAQSLAGNLPLGISLNGGALVGPTRVNGSYIDIADKTSVKCPSIMTGN